MRLRERGARLRDWFTKRGLNPWVALAYAAVVGLFLCTVAQFYIPGKGFSYLIAFGGNQEQSRLSKVRQLDYYIQRASGGYDAQFYVQIAMDPSLQNTQLKRAVDSLPYRARRILFPATAYVLGGGQPPGILQAYALLNVFCWLVLAVILLHWFPPCDWDFFFRWFGVLASLGLCLSFRNALIDGPSLMIVAFGLYLGDKGRPWWSTGVLALSGLGKETNLLGAASLLPKLNAGRSAWMLAILRGLLVAAPLIAWLCYLSVKLGPVMDPGVRNFDWPFVAYVRKCQQMIADLPEAWWPKLGPLWTLLMLVSLSVQFLFFLLRPQWSKAWWRVGMSFGVLMVVLGDAVWEGYPGAATRVLLPMQLAFNVLVPVGRRWRLVLLLGNLTFFVSPFHLQAPSSEGYVLGGDSSLFSTSAGKSFKLEYTQGWYGAEGDRSFFWCWARGDAGNDIVNPHPFAVKARLRFSLFSAGRRSVLLKVNGKDFWETTLGENQLITVTLAALELQPGRNSFEWKTDAPAVIVDSDPRELAFVVQNLHLDLLREMPVETAP